MKPLQLLEERVGNGKMREKAKTQNDEIYTRPSPGLGCLQAWLELAELAGVCLESGVCGGDRDEGGARCYTNK